MEKSETGELVADTLAESESLGGVGDLTEIVEPVTTFLEPVLAVFETIQLWFNSEILSTASLAQLVAIGVTLAVARLASGPFRRFIERIGMSSPPFVRYRLLRTVASISLPIVWAIGLWIAASVLVAMGESIVLLRLVYSLINAWILIRIVTTLIPSAYWSTVFSWCAWSAAALNAVGLLPMLIGWLDANALVIGAERLSLWTITKGAIVVGGMI